ncbi:MAG: acetate--CoA ligase [Dehalococcoidia bacterium]
MAEATPREQDITSVLHEQRMFAPPEAFAGRAQISGMDAFERLTKQAQDDPEGFWAEQAGVVHWFKKWDTVLDWSDPPFAKWFVGAKTNISYNCLDRHLDERGDKRAIVWEGEPGEQRTLTYRELHAEVSKFANVLKGLGVREGDRVGIYMPMVPELPIAMLACARIGAVHSVVFGGFSAEAVRERMKDAEAKVVITADGGYRRGGEVPLKPAVDDGIENVPSVQTVIVLRRTGTAVTMRAGRDRWWHELMQDAAANCPAAELDSEAPLYILYTSGTTGKPKGIVHTTGGYLLGVTLTTKWVFDLRPDDVYWCTADIGWVTGHSYIVYGPLSNGATVLMYEGAPNYPQWDRFWDIVERHKVNILYTAPTAIRSFVRAGDQFPNGHDLSSLRLLGTVGEPINPEAWMWYRRVIGGDRCPIVDTYWQTETGAIVITPLPGAIPTTPGSATRPFPGIIADVVDKQGNSVADNTGGYLVIKRPWPSMLRTLYKEPERFIETYFSQMGERNWYFTGDGARRDERGYFWVMGRVDDVVNVSGHRLGTMEVESALVSHPRVAEAAVVGRPDEIKGQAIVAFVTPKAGEKATDELKNELKAHVTKEIGALARPEEIRFTDALPKTRSGKIMRRLLRELATSGNVIGDTTTLEDFTVIAKLREDEE